MPTLSLAFNPPLPALRVASPSHRSTRSGLSEAWRRNRNSLLESRLESRRRDSAHASAEVLNAIATPTFGRTLALPFCTIVTTASAVPAGTMSSTMRRTDGYAAGPKRDLGERRNRGEKKGDCRHSREGMGKNRKPFHGYYLACSETLATSIRANQGTPPSAEYTPAVCHLQMT